MQQSQLPSSGGGSSFGWVIAVVLLSLLLLGALIFGFWAFASRQDYKDNVDDKITAAVKISEKETTDKNNIRFAEELKNPFKVYAGPESYGSVKVTYPKTWSGYINNSANSGESAVDMYFHPDVVPAADRSGDSRVAVALRVQVVNQPYSVVAQQREGQVTAGTLAASPYALPKLPGEAGMKFTGQLNEQINGTEVLLPLRDKTIIITTQTDTFLNDFNNIILPNLTFIP